MSNCSPSVCRLSDLPFELLVRAGDFYFRRHGWCVLGRHGGRIIRLLLEGRHPHIGAVQHVVHHALIRSSSWSSHVPNRKNLPAVSITVPNTPPASVGHRDLWEILGRSVVEWTARYDAKRNAEEVQQCLRQGQVRHLEVVLVHDDGTATPVEINASVVNSLYRLAQETMTNACRHGNSEKVRVKLTQKGDNVTLEVRDWGIRFDQRTVQESRFGLEGVRERARILGGKLSIKSGSGEGTVVRVKLPVIEATGEE